MAEDAEIPTERLQEEIDNVREREDKVEQREQKERGERRWLDRVAISTVLFAVFAAVAALQSGQRANEALLLANDAVFHETIAVDTWSEYQAQGIKRHIQESNATLYPRVGGTAAEVQALREDAAKRQAQQNALQKTAHDEEKQRDTMREDSKRALDHHERFALAVSLFQVAIGLGALAALTRQRLVWLVSVTAGVLALVVFADGYVLFDSLVQVQSVPSKD